MKESAVQTKMPEGVPQKASATSSPVLSTRSAVHPILQLQRAIGNQGVQRFIQAKFTITQPGLAQQQGTLLTRTEKKPSKKSSVAPKQAVEFAKVPSVDEEGSKESAVAAPPVGTEIPGAPATPEKAPASPQEDPAYQAVIKRVAATTKHEKTPPKKPGKKAQEVKDAAVLPPTQRQEEIGYGHHLESLERVPTPVVADFTVEGFTEKFRAKVNEIGDKLPKAKDEQGAVSRAVALGVEKVAAVQEVKTQNQNLSKPLRDEVARDPLDLADKAVAAPALTVDPAGGAPEIRQARIAAAKPKTDQEISLDDESRALDDALRNQTAGGQLINIDEGSLAFPISGEKTFDEAGETKRKAQEEIQKANPRYRETEKEVVTKSEAEMPHIVKAGLKDQHQSRSNSFDDVLGTQKSHEENIEAEKGGVFKQFQDLYKETKGLVDQELAKLTDIETSFEAVLNNAEQKFRDFVHNELEYIYIPGFFDYSNWKDINAPEINKEYERLKKEKGGQQQQRFGDFDYLKLEAMDNVRDEHAKRLFDDQKESFILRVSNGVQEIAATVVGALNKAKKHIRDGETKASKLYADLTPKEQTEADTAYRAVMDQYKSLDESVEERQREIINDMARTYNKSIGKLKATFDKIKEDVLTSWFKKAWNKIKAVVNAIIEFAKRIAELLGKLVGLVGEIISSPRYFFNNLITGIGQGFSTFVDRIDEFLATAFFDWFRGSSGIAIQLPKDWGPKGIFSLFTQLLNLSTETVWQRMEIVYDKTIANAFRRGEVLLDKGLEIFGIIKNEGLGGLWDHIVDSLGTLLSDTLDEMKETVLYAAIKKVIFEIGKLLVPGGGFIAIAEKIIGLVQFIVEACSKFLDLFESFVASIEKAVRGDIAGIVKLITGALTKVITIALDFLVTFFGLGSLKEKVERFIERMRNPVIRGIDFVLQKFKPLVMKGKDFLVKGKAALGLGGKPTAEEAIAGRDEEALPGRNIDKPVMLGKEKHTLRAHIEDDHVTILMASSQLVILKRELDVIKREWTHRLRDPEKAKQLVKRLEVVEKMANGFQQEFMMTVKKDRKKAGDDLDDNLYNLDNALEKIASDFGFAELTKVEVKEKDKIVDIEKGSWWVVQGVDRRQGSQFGIEATKYTNPESQNFFEYNEHGKTWGPVGTSKEPGSFDNPFELKWPKPASDDYPTLYFGGRTTEPITQEELKNLNGQEYPPGSKVKVKPYTPHGGGTLSEREAIGLKQIHHGWHLDVGTKVGPLQPPGVRTPGGGKIVDILKKYGFDPNTDKLQGDHVHDVQLGGEDAKENLWPLDAAVNQTAGPAVARETVHYPNGSGSEKISDLKKTTAPLDRYWFRITEVKSKVK
jgi:hypothetical protein